MEHIKKDPEAVKFFASYTIEYNDNIKGLPVERQIEYVNNASILNAIKIAWEEHTAARRKNGKRPLTADFWSNAIEVLPSLMKDWPHSLKYKNWRRLKDKFNDYLTNGYESLISKMYANENTVKITPEAGEWLVARFMSKVEIVTVEQLHAEFNLIADEKGWKQLKSVQSVYDYLQKPEIKRIWYAARYGELKAKEMFARQNRTILPTRRDSIWNGDGTKLNYYYQDEKGNIKTCQVYEVIDVYSECLLGHYISHSEDYEAQYYAFKEAVQTAGALPYELKYDNQGGHKKLENSDLLKNLANHAVRTAPYNGKSKTIESIFGRFQSQFLHKDWFFTGQNITAKKAESRQNMEFILANAKNLPTLDQIKELYRKRRKQWNEAPHPKTGVARATMYKESENDKTQKVGVLEMITVFGITTKQASTYRASGIEIQVKKKKYAYEVLTAFGEPDHDFNRRNINRKFFVRYCPDDMSIISLYVKEGKDYRFVAMAQPYLEVQRGIQDQTSVDRSRIKKNDLLNKAERIADEKGRNEILEKHGYHPNQHGLRLAPLKGVTTRKGKTLDIGGLYKEISNMDETEQAQRAERKEQKRTARKAQREWDESQSEFDRKRIELLKQQIVYS